jgi:hypothetical protein
MKTPKTSKGYLKMLIQIANDSVLELKGRREDEDSLISIIRSGIQNELGENANILALRDLEFTGKDK